jgi:hypothetical protein
MGDETFETMWPGDDGWSDWVHPLPGYRMQCCDCGLVHDMEFAIGTTEKPAAALNDGEDQGSVVLFRARRAA